MRKRGFGINIGSSSLLMIFVILCLVSFAALSIVSANADRKLSEKVITRTTGYYTACNLAEESLQSLDTVLKEAYSAATTEEEYYDIVGYEKEYVIDITDLQYLQVSIDILYPEDESGNLYRIRSWQVITYDNLEYDTSLTLLQ